MSTKKPDPATALIHHPYRPPEGFTAPQPGVFKASTVIFPNVAALRAQLEIEDGYTYGLHGTPTTFTLEERIATLEGGLQTLLVPSGLASIALVDMALLKAGDELLIPDNAYGPNKGWRATSWRLGHHAPLLRSDGPGLAGSGDHTGDQAGVAEAAGSVTMEFPDLPPWCIERASAASWLRSTTPGAPASPSTPSIWVKAWPVDISAHALTKYPSGGGDVLMGAVTTRDEALHLKLKFAHMRMGWGVGANDARWKLRAARVALVAALRRGGRPGGASRNGRAAQPWWRSAAPGAAGSPGTRTGQPARGGCGLFSVVFHEHIAAERVDAFVDALRLFKPRLFLGRPGEWRCPMRWRHAPASGWKGALVRFSLGLENVDDLIADCEQALKALRPSLTRPCAASAGPSRSQSFFSVALVVLGLALGQRDLGLHAAALVVQVQRHQG